MNVSEIFNCEPDHWGLRGDPLLWKNLSNSFENIPIPCNRDIFLEYLHLYIKEFIGHTLEEKDHFFVPAYDKGGMSSGCISCKFWLNVAIPLLLERLDELNG